VHAEIRCLCGGLRKKYGRREVLKGCSLSVSSGELVGVTGENGSGKSTLVRCLLGFTRPSSGTVWIDSSVGYCPQDNFLHTRFTLGEHLRLAMAILAGGRAVDTQYLHWLLQTLRLEEYINVRMGHLSGGSMQKVKFLTSILYKPRIVILDEPTDGFDWGMYLTYWDIVSIVRKEGGAVLMISHLLYDQGRFDRVYEMREGALAETSTLVGRADLPH
jgi:ABC-2 type transport system ATP-binding protein